MEITCQAAHKKYLCLLREAFCNGAGKTTASYTLLPQILNCREFVNADSIAAGLSPFEPDGVAFEAGRIMLQRIRQLMNEREDFAFETTLSTRGYVSLVIPACDYWLVVDNSGKEPDMVAEGETNLPEVIYNADIWNIIKEQGRWP